LDVGKRKAQKSFGNNGFQNVNIKDKRDLGYNTTTDLKELSDDEERWIEVAQDLLQRKI
jgi:hypothetical protein